MAATDERTRGGGDPGADAPTRLSGDQRRRLALLGLPTFGLALAITIVSTYLPTVAHRFTSSNTIIGLLTAGEGVFALLLPIPMGSWSDRLHTRYGGRLPFIAAGTPIAVVGLVLAGFVTSLAFLVVAALIFFAGYFIAYEPYRALYPDLVPEEAAGRAQSTQAVFRGLGTAIALLAGGLLLALGRSAPFLAGGALLVLTCGAFLLLADPTPAVEHVELDDRVRDGVRDVLVRLRADPRLQAFFVANALWELAIGALKTFVILWLTVGLGVSLAEAALVVGGVALIVLVGAVFSGELADRIGAASVMAIAAVAFGAPMAVLLVTTAKPIIFAATIPIALGGGVLLSLPYALMQPLMPDSRHGELTGLYSASRGVGVMLGPLLGGLAVSAGSHVWSSTQGYAAAWLVCGVASLLSLPFLRRVTGPRE